MITNVMAIRHTIRVTYLQFLLGKRTRNRNISLHVTCGRMSGSDIQEASGIEYGSFKKPNVINLDK